MYRVWPPLGAGPRSCDSCGLSQALIKFKNFFYFEEKDEPVEEFEKVGGGGLSWQHNFQGVGLPE